MPEIVLFLKSITDDISEENVEKIFDGLDDSGDRSIDFDEFKVETILMLRILRFLKKIWSCSNLH